MSRWVRMRDIQDHLINGTLDFFDCGIYWTIHAQADYKTGIWIGSAARLLATAPRNTTLRQVQRSLQRLRQIGWIKSFRRHGVRHNCKHIINKFEPLSGALRGMRLNAEKTTDCGHLMYEVVTEDGTDAGTERGTDVTPIHRLGVRGNGKKEKPPRSARSSPVYVGTGPYRDMICRDCGENFGNSQGKRDAHVCPNQLSAMQQ